MYMSWKMSRCIPFLCIIFCSFGYSVSNKKLTENYINNFKRIAVEEMRRTGIPASIKLAQGILESDLGRSPLASKANNHFGIKCGSGWTGNAYYKHDDDTDSSGTLIESCFRSYLSAEESYRAHSEFLAAPEKQGRYGFLFRLGPTDYEGWANGLRFSGYASDPDYPKKLIRIIESYKLFLLDEPGIAPASTETISKVRDITPAQETGSSVKSRIETERIEKRPQAETAKIEKATSFKRYVVIKVNELRCVRSAGGENLSSLAAAVGMDVFRIMEYNEECTSPGRILKTDEIIFLDRKKKTYDKEATHRVMEGETMYAISQLYGLRLETLRARNNVPADAEPIAGQYINLGKNLPKGTAPKFRKVSKKDNFMEL